MFLISFCINRWLENDRGTIAHRWLAVSPIVFETSFRRANVPKYTDTDTDTDMLSTARAWHTLTRAKSSAVGEWRRHSKLF